MDSEYGPRGVTWDFDENGKHYFTELGLACNKNIKDYYWKAIYAETDEEYDSIVSEMIIKAKEYGYDKCSEYCMNEAALRKEAEDIVLP
ncbi:MAG TPA: hypothetical protein GX002_03355 [Clostridiales bacterium]|nr:hypothetical protein [Clostridiales bacterium]